MEGEDFNFGLNNYDSNFDFLMHDTDYSPELYDVNYYGDAHVPSFDMPEQLEEYKYEIQELDDYSIVSESYTSSTFTTRMQDLQVDSKPPAPLVLPPIMFPAAPAFL